ncbi:hypothetical protein [Duganella violaceipulchra]|uniref:Uncharacterized protein n=1 Tax=Duganella violaceipulchra TaxID=2849652 RepID=A0AA41L449_9BURK|nr:hypothetical protein [Duganella violaceicalia]MBV6320547.1 hypothetical protein [Duganella violaceicalia]MCP2008745.1 hypothetical protein [Duganella violaceicalia]
MKSPYLEICRLLASSGYSLRDISEFLDFSMRQSPNGTVREIEAMRHEINHWISNTDFDEPRDYSHSEFNETAQKVERLLIYDVGMPKSVAIEILSHELILRYPGLLLPPEGRKGFLAWIRRVASIVPEKELLHIATNIRNRSVHDLPTDWRLK